MQENVHAVGNGAHPLKCACVQFSSAVSSSSSAVNGGAKLNTCTVQWMRAVANRVHIFLHFVAISALLYYRVSSLVIGGVPVIPWVLITAAELILCFVWVLTQAFRWRPVVRSVAIEYLPEDRKLPGVDVFICTADPKKEPVIEVMNTVLSAMALDYPADRLAVYLSDDGGAAVTLSAMKEAIKFAGDWLPFCRKYGVKTRSPEAYFSSFGDEDEVLNENGVFKQETTRLKSIYENFKTNVESSVESAHSVDDRPPHVEVIYDNKRNDDVLDDDCKMPLLVYVSREKRPSWPHRFKAGALNALLRVSGIMSNAPYILVLDCDMFCNDPTSAKQAMCFHLDPSLSSSLSMVQFPQIFYNVSKNDIYDNQARSAYKTKYQGMDGAGGAVCAGTGYYLKRKVLFCSKNEEDVLLREFEMKFGSSSEFIDTVKELNGKNGNNRTLGVSSATVEVAKNLSSCAFEQNTRWGKDIGYSYDSLLESSFTGYLLHCKGWKSVYLYPKRPCFLGCTTIDMNGALVQLMKWASGLLQVGLSKVSPLTYGISRMPLIQCLCYAYFDLLHINSVSCLIHGIVPQLWFLIGIPLYPEVTSPWFAVYVAVFASSFLHHIYDVLSTGGTTKMALDEQRIWIVKTVTGCLFGCLDVLLKYMGLAKANFRLTNKVVDKEKLEKYEQGKFNFEGAEMFMIPLTVLVFLNLGCLVGGVILLLGRGNVKEMSGQFLLCFYVLLNSVPILEGIVSKIRK